MRRPHPALIVLVIFAAAGAALLFFGRSRPEPPPKEEESKPPDGREPEPVTPGLWADPVGDSVLEIQSMLLEVAVQIRNQAAAGAHAGFARKFQGDPLLGGLREFFEPFRAIPYCVFRIGKASGDSNRIEAELEVEVEGREETGGIVHVKAAYHAVFARENPLWKIASLQNRSLDRRRADSVRYSNVTTSAGLRRKFASREEILEHREPFAYFGGIAAGDVDGDGDLDLFVPSLEQCTIYLNDQGVFAARDLEVNAFISSGLFVDVDNDGDLDLVLTQFAPSTILSVRGPVEFAGNALLLFRNDGRGNFKDATGESGLTSKGPAVSLAAADVDGDGDLDLHVSMYRGFQADETIGLHPLPRRDGRRTGTANQLWINDGTGRFREEAAARGLADEGWSLSAAFGDWDGDGDADLAVANEFEPVRIYRNEGGKFAIAAEPKSTSCGGGLTWVDWDGDGNLDLHVAGRNGGGRVLRNGTWETLAEDPSEWGWGGQLLEPGRFYVTTGFVSGLHDLDIAPLVARLLRKLAEKPAQAEELLRAFQGDFQRLHISAAGHPEVLNDLRPYLKAKDHLPILSIHGNEKNRLLGGDATVLGLGRSEDGRGFVVADFDQDGDLDLVIHNRDRRSGWNPLLALRNEEGGSGTIVRLRGTKSNRFGIGARVTLDGRVQEATCGTGWQSGAPPELWFRAGEKGTVRWPSGTVTEFTAAAGKIVTVSEDGTTAVDEPRRSTFGREAAAVPERGLREGDALPGEVKGAALVAIFSFACETSRREFLKLAELDGAARRAGYMPRWGGILPEGQEIPAEVSKMGIVRVTPAYADRLTGPRTVYPVLLLVEKDGRISAKICGSGAADAAIRRLSE